MIRQRSDRGKRRPSLVLCFHTSFIVSKTVSHVKLPPVLTCSGARKLTAPQPWAKHADNCNAVRGCFSTVGCLGALPCAQRGTHGFDLSNPSVIMQRTSSFAREAALAAQYFSRARHVPAKCPSKASVCFACSMKLDECLMRDLILSHVRHMLCWLRRRNLRARRQSSVHL